MNHQEVNMTDGNAWDIRVVVTPGDKSGDQGRPYGLLVRPMNHPSGLPVRMTAYQVVQLFGNLVDTARAELAVHQARALYDAREWGM